MKKLIVLMMSLMLCVACVAGCGNKNENSTTGGSESTGETTVEATGVDGSSGATENGDVLSPEDLATLPEEDDINDPDIDIDVDVDVDVDVDADSDPVDRPTEPTTEQEPTQPTTETPQPTEDDSDTDETTEPTQSAIKPTKDHTGDDEDDFVIDFDDLINKG